MSIEISGRRCTTNELYRRKFITFYSDKQSNEATAMYSQLTYYATFNVETIYDFVFFSSFFFSIHLFFHSTLYGSSSVLCVCVKRIRANGIIIMKTVFFFFFFFLILSVEFVWNR